MSDTRTITTPEVRTTTRLVSIDVVRGLVMVLMAVDHVRVYSGVPAGGPTLGIFLTRWVTHFCAPAFVFLAGTSAFLSARAGAGQDPAAARRGSLARHLAARGLVLVLLEVTLVRASWTFGVDYSQFVLAGVIWMLGWCMVLLAALVRLPLGAVAIVGLAIMAGQDALRALPGGWLSQFLYLGGQIQLGQAGPTVSVLYTIVPWIGVMAAGYAFGAVVTSDPGRRRRVCLRLGIAATLVFVVLAGLAAWSSASSDAPPLLIRILNQRKYPASQLFLLMTLGPTIALLAFAEHARGRVARALEVFGRVPMFYYLLHIPLIHAVSLVVWWMREGSVHPEWFATAPYVSLPPEHRWSLPLLYLVFAISVAMLYLR